MPDSDIQSYLQTIPGPVSVNGNLSVNGGVIGQYAASSGGIIYAGTTALTAIYWSGGSAFATGGTWTFNNAIILKGSVSQVNGIGTAGVVGVPAIYGATAPTHKTNAAPASTTYASPAAGFYRITVAADVKTATTLSLAMKVTYTDSEGTAQTDALVWTKEGSTTLLTAVVAADRYVADYAICASNATNIVVTDNSGTYTTCDYYYAVAIEQMA
jgi:hypothetical protein